MTTTTQQVSDEKLVVSKSSADAGRPKFGGDAAFHRELKRRVEAYFEQPGRRSRDSIRMYLKTVVVLGWFAASYLLLVFAATTWWHGALLAISLALSIAGIGFCIQHDANHGAYSKSKFINWFMGASLDMLGASSYVWHWKHNIFHHTYTNITGADDDLNIGPLARLTPDQPRYRFHRFQQFYMWGLYGFLLLKWHFVDDFKNVLQARISDNPIPRPTGWKLIKFIGGKLLFFSWTFGVPLFFHQWWVVLIFYVVTWYVVGLLLSVIFQLAHCVDGASFPHAPTDGTPIENSWAAHQVQTTVDFARRNWLLTWYLGGLNFQIEHHLFPKVSHIHYPQLSRIVQSVCAEYDVRYTAHDGIFSALAAHWRWLRRMGCATT